MSSLLKNHINKTIVYPISLSTRVFGSQVLQDSEGNTRYVDAQDLTSVDMAQTNHFTFAINTVQEWQRRTNCVTPTECETDADCSNFLNGA